MSSLCIHADRDHFVRLSVRPSVCLSVRLSQSQSYVSQVTHAFLGMPTLFFMLQAFMVIYSICPYPMSSLFMYVFVMLQAFIAGTASRAGDTYQRLLTNLSNFCSPGTLPLNFTVTVNRFCILWQDFSNHITIFFCRLRSIAAHRDHFVRRLSGSCAKLCFAGDTCIPRNAATTSSSPQHKC